MKTTLNQSIRKIAKAGTTLPATVIDVFMNTASVRLSSNGAVVRNLAIIGGPVNIGESVGVDYSGSTPVIIAKGKEWASKEDLQKLKQQKQLGKNDTVLRIMRMSGGTLIKQYPVTASGLAEALADCISGDVISVLDVDITGDFVVPDGVSLCGLSKTNSILRGEITLNANCSLENLSVANSANSADALTAVVIAGTGVVIDHCNIWAYQCGAGNTLAIDANSNGVLVEYCQVVADSKGGTGTAFSTTSGTTKINHSTYYAKTTAFDGDNYVYSNTTCDSNIAAFCQATNNIYGSTGSNYFDVFSMPGLQIEGNTEYSYSVTGTATLVANEKRLSNWNFQVFRVGEFLYYIDHDSTSKIAYVTEYDVANTTSKVITISNTQTIQSKCGFVVTEEHVAYVAKINDSGDYAILKCDFGLETAVLVDTISATVSIEGTTYDRDLSHMITATIGTDKYLVVACDLYATLCGMTIYKKNITQDGTSVTTDWLDDIGSIWSQSQARYANGKVYWVTKMYGDGGGSGNKIAVRIFDIENDTITSVTHIAYHSTNYPMVYNNVFASAQDINTGKIYYWNEIIPDIIESTDWPTEIIEIDSSNDSVSQLVEFPNFYSVPITIILLEGNNGVYYIKRLNNGSDAGNVYSIDGTLLFTTPYGPTVLRTDGHCTIVDDNNKFWFYQRSGTKLNSIDMTSGTTTETTLTGMTNASVTPNWEKLVGLGDRFAITTLYDASGGKSNIYMVT